tara:strand:+ start:5931 stop:6773 length:843 start_codon:yes stop_codon:yes gene_type:complete
MNALKLINSGSFKLKSHYVRTHMLDSEILLSKVLGKKREEILINLMQEINTNQIRKFNNFIKRRSLKEPVAYIVSKKEFWSKDFEVSKDTLIPRPETELMIEELIKIYRKKSIKILDIGVGSGCILISLLSELDNSFGIGIDISKKALLIANKNSKKHKVNKRLKLLNKSFVTMCKREFDLVVSNPPYIRTSDLKNLDEDIKNFEPLIALDGGNDGLDVIRKVIYKAKYILKINGILALEIGYEQYKKVSKILKINNFKVEKNIKDNNENIRCVISRLLK